MSYFEDDDYPAARPQSQSPKPSPPRENPSQEWDDEEEAPMVERASKDSEGRDQIPAKKTKKKRCGKKGCGGWCWPFIIYLILSLITIIFFLFSQQSVGETVTYVLLQLIWIIIIGFIIYWLCKSGHTGWAWFVLFLPLIVQIVWVILAALL